MGPSRVGWDLRSPLERGDKGRGGSGCLTAVLMGGFRVDFWEDMSVLEVAMPETFPLKLRLLFDGGAYDIFSAISLASALKLAS